MHKRKRAVSIDGFKDVPTNDEASLAKVGWCRLTLSNPH
jgi:hypothetical protein